MSRMWRVQKVSFHEEDLEFRIEIDEALYYALPRFPEEITGIARIQEMPTVFEVPAGQLIERLAKHLKQNVGDITPPAWSEYAKTGAHKTRPPQNPDWWYSRCASLMRKLYVHGPVGVARLRVEYGGRVGRGNRREHHVPAGGSSIREPLQQLEKVKLVTPDGKKGRKLTREGIVLLNRTAMEVAKELKAGTREVQS